MQRVWQNAFPCFSIIPLIEMILLLSSWPVSKNTFLEVPTVKWTRIIKTSGSGELMVTGMFGKHLCIWCKCSTILVSASSWLEHNSFTLSFVVVFPSSLFKEKHSCSSAKYMVLPWSFLLNFGLHHSWNRKSMNCALLLGLWRNWLPICRNEYLRATKENLGWSSSSLVLQQFNRVFIVTVGHKINSLCLW